jgi:hypothetical protein
VRRLRRREPFLVDYLPDRQFMPMLYPVHRLHDALLLLPMHGDGSVLLQGGVLLMETHCENTQGAHVLHMKRVITNLLYV